MARMRTLKPEFFRDKKIAKLGPVAALVYQALWCMADDGGAAPADPERVWGEMFVYWPGVTVEDTTVALRELSRSGRIRFYQVGDDRYALIPTFEDHQRPSNPSKYRYPRSDQGVTEKATVALPEHSHSTHPSVVSSQVSVDSSKSFSLDAKNGAEGEPPWSRQAVDLAREVPLQVEPGRYLRILKKFVERDGPDKVLARWRTFLDYGRMFDDGGTCLDLPRPITCLTPERFRDSYAEWTPPATQAAS